MWGRQPLPCPIATEPRTWAPEKGNEAMFLAWAVNDACIYGYGGPSFTVRKSIGQEDESYGNKKTNKNCLYLIKVWNWNFLPKYTREFYSQNDSWLIFAVDSSFLGWSVCLAFLRFWVCPITAKRRGEGGGRRVSPTHPGCWVQKRWARPEGAWEGDGVRPALLHFPQQNKGTQPRAVDMGTKRTGGILEVRTVAQLDGWLSMKMRENYWRED